MTGLCPEASSPLLYPAASIDGPPDEQVGALHAQCSCPWVALNPWDGLLYSALFDPHAGPKGGILVHVYDVNDRIPISKWAVQNLEDQLRIPQALFDALDTDGDGVVWVFRFVRAVELGASLQRIQGGCFSNDGCLFLINDVEGNHGVWRFSMLNGALLDVIGVDREESFKAEPQECEGICLYGSAAPYALGQGNGGQSFVCATVWEGEGGTDFVWLKRMKLGPFVP
jgi:hypothetical protein